MKKNFYRKISKNVILLGVVSFLNDFSSEMIIPILPMFITALGGGGVIVGVVGGIRESIASILKVISGYLSDKSGKRKIFVFLGYFSSALFKLLLAFSRTWKQILVFSGLERVGKGIRTAPRDAIIADSMPGSRGRGFGIHRAFDTSGAILGSVAVFILYWSFSLPFNTIILLASFLAFFSLLPLFSVRETRTVSRDISFSLSLASLPRNLKLFVVVAGIFSLANFSYMFFILKAQKIFTGRAEVAMPIILYVLFNIFYAGLSLPFGNLSDRIGRKKVITLGYFLFLVTVVGFSFFNSLGALIVLFILYGASFAIIDGNQRAYVSDLAPPELKSTALGVFHTVIGMVSLPASIIAGFLWQYISPSAPFIYSSFVSGLAVILFLAFDTHME